MKKRLIPLLVFTIVLAVAPAAMANHCDRCLPTLQKCVQVSNFGYQFCVFDAGWHLENPCGSHALPPSDLAFEFTVASVERIDEPQTAASETQVASLETAKQATR